MKKLHWVMATLAVSVIGVTGCATTPTMTGQHPVRSAAADMAAAQMGPTASAMTADKVTLHLGSGVVPAYLDNGFGLIAPRTLLSKPQGPPIDFVFKWKITNKERFGIGLLGQQTPERDCRWVLAPKVAINPDRHLLKNPAFKSDHDQLRAFGLSVQLALRYVY